MATQETKVHSGRMLGVIARMDGTRAKGYGFIKDGDNNEYFLHRTACLPNTLFDDLQEGDPVSFKVSTTPKGQKAHDLQRATLDERAVVSVQEEDRGNR